MIIIESKRKKLENILKKYPGAVIVDVTSKATDGLVKLSPFYPHGDIPVPFSQGYTATCVEAVWQGLKVFEDEDVDKPPYLINCKDELLKEGFRKGIFHTDSDSLVFVASDAMAHYIIMMYEVASEDKYRQELEEAESKCSKNGNYIKVARALHINDFENDVINKLVNAIGHTTNFQRHIQSLLRKGLIAYDDYSLAILKNSTIEQIKMYYK